jgi:hypothetical protein
MESEKIISLLDQIIEYNFRKDSLTKKELDSGDSWNVHHLNLLKKLIEEDNSKK